jgi:hypothetical protein
MILKSFGCSFTFGSDLHDSQKYLLDENRPVPSQFSWPALLAKNLNGSYECFASPGAGNLKILEKVLTQSANDIGTSIFVINWSFIDRYDYIVGEYLGDHWDPIDNEFWHTIRPTSIDQVATTYYQNLHSQLCDKLKTLTYIKCVIDSLTQKNIPFIMTYLDDLIFETEWHTTPAIIDLQNYIRLYMTTFENQTFLNWSKQKGFLFSETLHPLEDAHQAAFELIKPTLCSILHKV